MFPWYHLYLPPACARRPLGYDHILSAVSGAPVFAYLFPFSKPLGKEFVVAAFSALHRPASL